MLQRGFFGGEFDSSERFRVELHDDDVLVLDLRHHLVHRIPGSLVDDLIRGVPLPELAHLPAEALPFVRESLAGGRVARRRVLISGGALAIGGIITSALPFAAAAASRYLTFTDATVQTFTAHEGSGSTTDVNRIQGFGGTVLTLDQIGEGRIQVLMSGTQGGIGGTGTTGTPGLGTYALVEIANLPATNSTSAGRLALSLRQGGAGNSTAQPAPVAGGEGGMGAFVYLTKLEGPGEPAVLTMIAAAAGGGGASGSGSGGDASLGNGGNGTSDTTGKGGGGASTAAGGAEGAVIADGYLSGGAPRPGLTVLSTNQTVPVARSNPAWSYGGFASNRRAGGGGGAGFMFGGGGDAGSIGAGPYPVDAGGGGGGASYTKTSTTGAGDPYVTTQRLMTTARTVESGATLTVYYYPAA